VVLEEHEAFRIINPLKSCTELIDFRLGLVVSEATHIKYRYKLFPMMIVEVSVHFSCMMFDVSSEDSSPVTVPFAMQDSMVLHIPLSTHSSGSTRVALS